MENSQHGLFGLFDYPLTLSTIAIILDTLDICRENFIFCHQLKKVGLSENIFQIYSSIYPLEKFFKNPEKDTTAVLKNRCYENRNRNHSKIPVKKLTFY